MSLNIYTHTETSQSGAIKKEILTVRKMRLHILHTYALH